MTAPSPTRDPDCPNAEAFTGFAASLHVRAPESDKSATAIGVVVIGRNEGERLRRSLTALGNRLTSTVYVDSGSTDGSATLAQTLGATVVELDTAEPFSAARARNSGFATLIEQYPQIEFVQFVDGDCELASGWLDTAESVLRNQPITVAVFGRLHERHPDASIYNRACEIEWNWAPVGPAQACGGNAMFRVQAFRQTNGFDAAVLAAEDDELCLRLRRAGGTIERIDADMGWHDAAITSFGQWWRRTVRTGAAYAQGAALHGRGDEQHFVAEKRRAILWGFVLPLAIALTIVPTRGWSLLALVFYVVSAIRFYRATRNRGVAANHAASYAALGTLAKFPHCIGIARYYLGGVRRVPARLIEYK